MNDTTVAPARRAQRAQSARRGGPSGRQVVGEYVGQPAGDAAQAVRRAGLCPGLDRSFGCDSELIGLVVEQEPSAGSDLARNGMVTLYVAAPGSGPTDEEPATSDPPAQAPVASEQAESEPPDTSSSPTRARRRKPGLAQRGPRVFDPPPAPILLEREPAAQAALTQEWSSPNDPYAPGEDLVGGSGDERGETELSHDEFVVHLDDVLAGRANGPRRLRRVYPHRRTATVLARGGGVRAWLGEHSLLVRLVGAALAVWILVGLASALDGQHARTPTASAISSTKKPAPTHTPETHVRVPAPRVKSARPETRPPQAHTFARSTQAPHHLRGRPPVREIAAPPERPVVQTSPARSPAPRAATGEPSAPAARQTQGGLFSP